MSPLSHEGGSKQSPKEVCPSHTIRCGFKRMRLVVALQRSHSPRMVTVSLYISRSKADPPLPIRTGCAHALMQTHGAADEWRESLSFHDLLRGRAKFCILTALIANIPNPSGNDEVGAICFLSLGTMTHAVFSSSTWIPEMMRKRSENRLCLGDLKDLGLWHVS